MKTITSIYFAVILFTTAASFAQYGILDNSFGIAGKVSTAFNPYDSSVHAMALQPDGKIVAAGAVFDHGSYSQLVLVCYNSNGSLDSSFGIGGKVASDFSVSKMSLYTIVLQPDGKIIGAGIIYNNFTDSQFVLVRYNSDGTLDTEFGTGGIVIGDGVTINSLALQSNGKIIAAGFTFDDTGNRDFLITRYNNDGTLDVDFGTDGVTTTSIGERDLAYSLALQPDGKIVLAGSSSSTGYYSDFAIVRYNNGGTLDSTFGNNGIVLIDVDATDQARAVKIQSDGKIVFVGYSSAIDGSSSSFSLGRLLADGNLDNSFATNGMVTGAGAKLGKAVITQSDGKILLCGACEVGDYDNVALVRYQSNGVLDATFGADGKVTTPFSTTCQANSLLIQTDGRILAGGEAGTTGGTYSPDFAVLRYNSGLELSNSEFNSDKNIFRVYPNPVNQIVNLDFTLAHAEVLSFVLYDSNGRKIGDLLKGKDFAGGYNSQKLEMPEALAKGIYFLNVSNGRDSLNLKIVK